MRTAPTYSVERRNEIWLVIETRQIAGRIIEHVCAEYRFRWAASLHATELNKMSKASERLDQ
jgi:hypothetical protein